MAAVQQNQQRGFAPQQQGQGQQRQVSQPPQDGSAVSDPSRTLKVAGIAPGNQVQGDDTRRTKSGRFTMAQLRQTDGIVPLQYGTNQFDSQKMMTSFGTPRDVRGKHLKRIWELEFPDEEVGGQPINIQQQSNGGQYQQQGQQFNAQQGGQFQQRPQQQSQGYNQQQRPQQGFNQAAPAPQQYQQTQGNQQQFQQAAPAQQFKPPQQFNAPQSGQFQAAPQSGQFQAAPQSGQFQAAPQSGQFQATPNQPQYQQGFQQQPTQGFQNQGQVQRSPNQPQYQGQPLQSPPAFR